MPLCGRASTCVACIYTSMDDNFNLHVYPMAPTDKVTVLEHCQIKPSIGAGPEKSLRLTFFDSIWLNFSHMHRLLFYEFPHSQTHFTETVIPQLKESLSLTLKHFLPIAGNLIIPSNSSKPIIRYLDGDSISLTFAASDSDFNSLTQNQARNAGEFYHLVPQLPPVSYDSDSMVTPVVALQVTLFPNIGMCVGVSNHHTIGDASTMVGFMRAWALITKHGGDGAWLASGSLPFYDRTVIKDPNGLEEIFRSQVGEIKLERSQTHRLPISTDKVRATFVISKTNTQQLKQLVLAQRPTLSHVSSFTVTCAYVWTCMVKSRTASGEDVNDNELEHFIGVADCRARLDPPIPTTYFGNCLAPCVAMAKSTQLMGEEGFLIAAELIGESLRQRLHGEEGVLKGAETWLSEVEGFNWERVLGVAASPKFKYYDTNFGWGNPMKLEFVSIDFTGSMSLIGCRESEGDLEIGLSLPKIKMDAFATFFAEGLKIL